jgi:hypothetical protein
VNKSVRRPAALLATLISIAAAGCGQTQPPSQRAAVAAYLHHVDRVENSLKAPLAKVTQTVGAFSLEERSDSSTFDRLAFAANERALRSSLSRIRPLCARLLLRAPAPAANMRALLIRVCSGEARMTDQTAKLILFVPAFAAEQGALRQASVSLERALAAQTLAGAGGVTAAYEAKAAALRRFQSTVEGIAARAQQLAVPDASKPDYRAQLRALEGMSSSAGQLASALVSSPQGDVQASLARFDRAALSNQSLAVRRAQIAAVRAYDAEAATLTALSHRIALERLHLDATLK